MAATTGAGMANRAGRARCSSITKPSAPKPPAFLPAGWPRCYSSLEPHCKMADEQDGIVESYRVQWLTSMRVLFAITGTVYQMPLLWIEWLSVGAVYNIVFLACVFFDPPGFVEIVGDDASIRGFLGMFSTFIGLLLTFYTSLRIARWWSMREDGIKKICEGSETLVALLIACVTRRPEILDAVQRYAQASLYLFWILKDPDELKLQELMEIDMLTQDEADKLRETGNSSSWPEAVWVWLANIVTKCNKAGLTAGPPHYVQLMMAVDSGRRGAANIRMFFETPMPLGYVHLLGLMVKSHNVLLCFLMALLGAKHIHQSDYIAFARTCFRAAFMPFLYNSILMISDQLADPFDHDPSSFPFILMRNRMVTDSNASVDITESLPAWMSEWRDREAKAKAAPKAAAAAAPGAPV